MYVVVHYSSRSEQAGEAVASIAAKGGTAFAVGGDVANEDDMRSSLTRLNVASAASTWSCTPRAS